jgi:hypothetical protein
VFPEGIDAVPAGNDLPRVTSNTLIDQVPPPV